MRLRRDDFYAEWSRGEGQRELTVDNLAFLGGWAWRLGSLCTGSWSPSECSLGVRSEPGRMRPSPFLSRPSAAGVSGCTAAQNAHCTRASSPQTPGTRFAYCPMQGRMYGDGFDERGDVNPSECSLGIQRWFWPHAARTTAYSPGPRGIRNYSSPSGRSRRGGTGCSPGPTRYKLTGAS